MHHALSQSLALALLCLPATRLAGQDPIYVFDDLVVAGSRADRDRDGHDDLHAHVPTGLAWISGRDGTVQRTLIAAPFERLLAAVDLDGDGTLELVHTRALYTPADMFVRRVDGRLLYRLRRAQVTNSFGFAVVVLDDWNRDGVRDLAIPAPSEQSAGRIYVYSGSDGAPLTVLLPRYPFTGFGQRMEMVPDVDGDGLNDLVIAQDGRVGIYAGGSGAHLYELGTPEPLSRFGCDISVAGDANGDGVTDIVIGILTRSRDGKGAVLCCGRTGAEIHAWTGPPEDVFGMSVAGLGDVDGDGAADVAVGAPQHRFWPPVRDPGPGYVRVFSGRDGSELFTLHGDANESGFGTVLGAAGDVDGDTVPDLVVASATTSRSTVFSGRQLALTASRHVVGAAGGGEAVLALDAGAVNAGAIYLVLGSTSGRSGFDLDGVRVPLTLDGYLLATIGHANGPFLIDTLGVLDGAGRATATVRIPPAPALRGVCFDHAFIAARGPSVTFASNATPLTVQ